MSQRTSTSVGRPTDYDPNFDYDKAVDDYLETCGREQTKLPKLSEFARVLGINRDTVQEWAKIHPKFSVTIKRISDAQAEQLQDDGMYGGKEVNSTMAIFLLKANHGLIETSRQEITGKDGDSFNVKLISPRDESDD